MNSIFEIKNLHLGYDEVKVLNGINLSVKKGNFIAIIGPNGAGKSTMLKAMAGLIKPISGEILFKNCRMGRYSRRDLAMNFSVVHQFHENILPFTVCDFIRLGRFPHQKLWQIETAEDRAIIDSAIEMTGISHLLNRQITELSGGEQQLVFITQALAQNSDIIILDEPVSHLDIHHTTLIMDILHRLNHKGTTVITVLHDMNIASDYCSRICALKKGEIFFNGTPEEVLKYNLIEKLFETPCVVLDNPISHKPFVYPVPEYITKK
jgi:iron complex transport system ATP-binding protein